MTIFAHALIPVGSPLVKTTGSAFSAATSDVSLGASRRDAGAKALEALSPSDAHVGDVAAPRPLAADPLPVRSPAAAPAPDPVPIASTPPPPFLARGPPATA